MNHEDEKKLRLDFHGRIIDHLGIQMYQSPVAAVAELIANAWDADAERVEITLPDDINPEAAITIKDNGVGMTFEECQERYLRVGWCRRGEDPAAVTEGKGRRVLGRKGIGKFAGFGISDVITVETISASNGEKTVFEMDINILRGDEYIKEGGEVPVLDYLAPDEERRISHGTRVILRNLKLKRRLSEDQFSQSMARRFLRRQKMMDFDIRINEKELPDNEEISDTEFLFPRDYRDGETPEGLTLDGEWGVETLPNGKEIRWRIVFTEKPVKEKDLLGISVFAGGKIAQSPFTFNLSGGLSGQHGLSYLVGQVEADYIDLLKDDLIATERQRINWENDEAFPLEKWGQDRVKQLLQIWQRRRVEKKENLIYGRDYDFSERLAGYTTSERKTIEEAIKKIAAIPTLTETQFVDLVNGVMTTWEQGRLRKLIEDFVEDEDYSAESLLRVLAEADVLVALNIAEIIKNKIDAIRVLRKKVEEQALENEIRDYIAERPYLLHQKWETFKKETSIKHILDEAAEEAGLIKEDLKDAEEDKGQRRRIDLALRSNNQLLIVEFMRPGKTADYDHLARCQQYLILVEERVKTLTALGIDSIEGIVVADKLENNTSVRGMIGRLAKQGIYVCDWQTLLSTAERDWEEYMEIIGERAPADRRVQDVRDTIREHAAAEQVVTERATELE